MNGDIPQVKCQSCGMDVPVHSDDQETDTAAGLLSGSLPSPNQAITSFANGIGAMSATTRLASLARRDNIFLIIAAMIAMDYFELISRVQSVVPVC